MLRKILPIALFAGAVLTPLAGQGKTAIVLKPLEVRLPEERDASFPAGPGAEAADNNCLACHSVEMVMNQPAMASSAWKAEVDKMRAVYKAPVPEADVAAIVDYLARIKGTQ